MQNLFQILVMIAAFNFLSAIAFGQSQWTRQSPLPAARNLTGAAWATPTHGFASGEYGTFIETFDGGATWRNVNLNIFPSDPFYNVYCRDADNCFVIGNSGTNGPDHWRTTDGGATWQRITNFPLGGSWYHIDFVSATVGFMGSNGAVARTTDGGATWALMSGYPSCPVIYGMDFRDAQVGLAGGNRVSTTDGGPGIFKTTDAGVTWIRKFLQSANDVLWLSDTTAIAIVGGSIYRSTDAGRNLVSDFKPDFHRLGRDDVAAKWHDCRRFRRGRRLAQCGWRF
ncbi:MAG: YCF48-related protein [Pyrinomonadaceae bacterium]